MSRAAGRAVADGWQPLLPDSPAAVVAARGAAPGRASRAALTATLHVGLAFLLFGDYLSLSISHALTGESGNWIAGAAVAQLVLLPLAVVSGQLRGILRQREVWIFAGLGAVMLAHVALLAVTGRTLNGYGEQKTAAFFLLCGPSLLLGWAAGRAVAPPPARWLILFAAPLLLCSLASLALEPARLTIDYFYRLHAYAGVLVQPAHQALAFALAKIAFGAAALWVWHRGRTGPRRLSMAVFAICLGLIAISGARAYTIAALVALAPLAIRLRRAVLWPAAIATVTIVAFYSSSASEVLEQRFDPGRVLESLAYQERAYAWQTSWQAFLSSPLIGVGPGGFAELDAWAERSYPHNIFLEFASECGLLGLLLLVGLLGSVGLRVWRTRGAPPSANRALALSFAVFAVVGVQAVGDWIRNHFLFMALGMLMAACQSVPATEAQRR